eukprot:3774070-Pleurochrysis_carterae.AAC.5
MRSPRMATGWLLKDEKTAKDARRACSSDPSTLTSLYEICSPMPTPPRDMDLYLSKTLANVSLVMPQPVSDTEKTAVKLALTSQRTSIAPSCGGGRNSNSVCKKRNERSRRKRQVAARLWQAAVDTAAKRNFEKVSPAMTAASPVNIKICLDGSGKGSRTIGGSGDCDDEYGGYGSFQDAYSESSAALTRAAWLAQRADVDFQFVTLETIVPAKTLANGDKYQ